MFICVIRPFVSFVMKLLTYLSVLAEAPYMASCIDSRNISSTRAGKRDSGALGYLGQKARGRHAGRVFTSRMYGTPSLSMMKSTRLYPRHPSARCARSPASSVLLYTSSGMRRGKSVPTSPARTLPCSCRRRPSHDLNGAQGPLAQDPDLDFHAVDVPLDKDLGVVAEASLTAASKSLCA